jgi:hypothetical protein
VDDPGSYGACQVNSRSILLSPFQNWNLPMTANDKRRATNAARAEVNAMQPKTSEQCRAVLTAIAERREGAAARLREITEERRSLALAAHGGDREASARMAALNAESAELVVTVDCCNLAEEEARGLLAEAEKAEAAEADRQRRQEAERLARLLDGLAPEIDEAIRAVVAKIQRRDALLAELLAPDPLLAQRMRNRSSWALQLAMEAAGLTTATGLRMVRNAGRQPLQVTDGALLANLLGKTPAPAQPSPMPQLVPPSQPPAADEDGWTRNGSAA